MRQIRKRTEPRSLSEWRAVHATDPNFGYGLIGSDLRLEILRSLIHEQGRLCAYTGRALDERTCHIEHPIPQVHCQSGEDVSYRNMLACVPAPNHPHLPYGAHKKGAWPDRTQRALFVSPLSQGCGARFSFSLRGVISPRSAGDSSAQETITRLGLDHEMLNQLRRAAIDATLAVYGRGPASIGLSAARRRLERLHQAEQLQGPLEPFCFVKAQALELHIGRTMALRAKRRPHQ
jgi:uncharacterized protein (TIGR02646 family)